MDMTRDTNGDEVLVWFNANDPAPVARNAFVKIRLSDGHQTPLVSFDWSLATHISAPDGSGYVFVETYRQAIQRQALPHGCRIRTNCFRSN